MLKAALFILVGVLLDLGYLSFWLLFVTSLLNGILGAFIFPAWNDFVREIAPGGRVAALDSALMSFSAIAGIFGVIVGGLMLDAWGPGSLFLLNGFSYVVYAIPLALFPAVRAAPVGTGRGSMGEALRVVHDTEALRSFVIIAVMVQLVAWPLLNLLPQISTDIGENAIIFSLLLSSLYAGMALVAPILTIREKQYSHWHIAIVALIILMIATTLVALAPLVSEGVRLVVLMIVLVPLGMALNMTSVLTSAAVQTGAPREHVPGVLALYSALITVIAPVGALVITGIADASSVWIAVLVEALGIGALLLYLSSPRVRAHLVTALSDRHHVVRHHARHGSVARTLPGDVTPVGRHGPDPVASGGPPGA
ncbi:MAG: MFS transporter, partial [Actinomycetota bacterium]